MSEARNPGLGRQSRCWGHGLSRTGPITHANRVPVVRETTLMPLGWGAGAAW